jgi:hypothetical protein
MRKGAAVALALVLCLLQVGLTEAQMPAESRTWWGSELSSRLRQLGLTFGGELEVDASFTTNADLDSATDDELSLVQPQFSLWFGLERKYVGGFVELQLDREWALDEPEQEEDEERSVRLEPREAYLWLRPFGDERLSALVGRQKFSDEREWLFDERVDAVRLRSGLDRFVIEASVSRDGLFTKDLLADREEEEGRVNNWLLVATYEPAKDVRLSAYTLIQDDRDREESPIYFGLHSSGEPVEQFTY